MSTDLVVVFFFFSLISSLSSTGGFDPMDSNGNITIKWDVLKMDPDNFETMVTIYNNQLYRHIEWPPGWSLSWEWQGDEVINYIAGAEAKEQGVCNRTWGGQRPHCCLKNPVIIDLNPGAPYNKQVANCCKGGVLSSLIQDPSTAAASFQMNVGLGGNGNVSNLMLPGKFRFGSPGYSCGNPEIIDPPTKFPEDRGRRWTQALKTWKVICTFSQFQASPTPTCCVSLSAFYSPTIIKCQTCSCGCREPSQSKCLKAGEMPSAILQPKDKDPDAEPPLVVMCSIHMCPIQVHWHVKQSYKEYWRLKITITNLNAYKNYSQWNLAVKHPNLQSIAEVFSFNYRPLNISGPFNDTGLFWGIQKYNDMLLQMGENGFVQTELILHKDLGQFTFNSGWAFPRRIYFDGQECVMPPPDEFPSLPKERIKAYK